jgi:hypothetical protein
MKNFNQTGVKALFSAIFANFEKKKIGLFSFKKQCYVGKFLMPDQLQFESNIFLLLLPPKVPSYRIRSFRKVRPLCKIGP